MTASPPHPDYPDETAHLRAVGYWRPMDRRRTSSRPDPRELVDTTRSPQERAELVSRLRAGTVLFRWLGSSTCRFCGLRPNGNTCLTDGVNVWPEGLAHYVEAHDVWVDLAPMVHALKHGLALCGAGAPSSWPDGVRWVSFQDRNVLTFTTCRACHDALARTSP